MTPRKPRLGPREAFTMPCKTCGTDYRPTERQIQFSRSFVCPACIEAKAEAVRDRKAQLELNDPQRAVGRDLAQLLQRVWR